MKNYIEESSTIPLRGILCPCTVYQSSDCNIIRVSVYRSDDELYDALQTYGLSPFEPNKNLKKIRADRMLGKVA